MDQGEKTPVPYPEATFFFQRIESILRLRGETIATFSKKIGSKPEVLQNIFSGQARPKSSTLIRLYKALNLSHEEYGLIFREHLLDRIEMSMINESPKRTIGVVFTHYKGFNIFTDFFFPQSYTPRDVEYYLFSADQQDNNHRDGDSVIYCSLETAYQLLKNQDLSKVLKDESDHKPITSDDILEKYGSPFDFLYIKK